MYLQFAALARLFEATKWCLRAHHVIAVDPGTEPFKTLTSVRKTVNPQYSGPSLKGYLPKDTFLIRTELFGSKYYEGL